MTTLSKFFEGHEIRILDKHDEYWFVAADVCRVLELTNPTMVLSRLEPDERSKFNLGRQGLTNVVNEQGLYELIFASRKAEAKTFKRWIKKDVLPTIRKHGVYATPDKMEEMLNDPDTMITVLQKLKEERAEKEKAQQQIKLDEPKVALANAFTASRDSVLMKDLAVTLNQNGYKTGTNRLFHWMREEGYLCKKVGDMYNLPTQRSMDRGLFEVKKGVRSGSQGEMKQTRTTLVTAKGQMYFINKLLGHRIKAM